MPRKPGGKSPTLDFYPFPLKAVLGNFWLELPIGFWVSGVALFCGVFSGGNLFAPAEYDYFEGLKGDQAIGGRNAGRCFVIPYFTYPFPLKAVLGNFLLQVIYSSLWV
ncbi:MAG: hypothetical protein B1H13_05240 [Desulfobacteraceae bacterium 4484_190.3]|nr:MAG: hypothetical protein B1H13_05240 [Desulfobacteraceae bacterium 4484_190.3]